MGAIFCDIDGTILRKPGDGECETVEDAELLPGSLEQLLKWKEDGNLIVLTTARPCRMKSVTVAQLTKFGIPCDMLLMGIPVGDRILVNDNRPDRPNHNRAIAISLNRNEGIHF